MNILRGLLFIIMLTISQSSLSVDSGGNSVYIDQSNADSSSVSITQTGSNNTVGDPTSVAYPSFIIEGNSMFMTFTQDGMNNALTGNIIGGGTTANITQTGNSNSTNINMGIMGTASGLLNMTFTGSNNISNMNIGILHDSGNYDYTALITGSNNILTNTINSKYVVDSFTVTGSNNTITTNQIGANGSNIVKGNNIAISNIGSNNVIGVTQDGTTNPNSVIINLTGSNAAVSVIQH